MRFHCIGTQLHRHAAARAPSPLPPPLCPIALQVARNILFEPKLLPGGGATEMAISVALNERSKALTGVEQWPFRAVASALEVVPRTLAQNCGADTVRLMTQLRAAKQGACRGYLDRATTDSDPCG